MWGENEAFSDSAAGRGAVPLSGQMAVDVRHQRFPGDIVGVVLVPGKGCLQSFRQGRHSGHERILTGNIQVILIVIKAEIIPLLNVRIHVGKGRFLPAAW